MLAADGASDDDVLHLLDDSATSATLSEQNLVDCDKVDKGCEGGLMDNGFRHARENPLMLEAAYPYTAKDGTCKYDQSKGFARVKTYHDVTPNS